MSWAIYLGLHALGNGFQTGEYRIIPIIFFGSADCPVLIFGLAAAWAFRGFKMESEQPKH
jgi:hypothetical protein